MTITPSFLKKLFSVLIVTIFSISLLFFGFDNLQPKSASALEINKCLDKDANAKNYSYYNFGTFRARYNSSNYNNQGCDILTNSIQCLICNCNNGVDCSNNVYPDSSSIYCQSNGAYYIDINSYNNACNVVYPVYVNNYPYNNNYYNTCVNCFEQAISQLQNGVNGNLGNASVSYDLLNTITVSQRSDIPTTTTSYVNGNTATTEIKNYSGTILASTSFSIDERGNTTLNVSNSSSVVPNCNQNFNLFICDSFSTIQIANQFGNYGSITTPFKSTFTNPANQNYNNVAYNYIDYYYPQYDCSYSLFGCSY
jgi:hypothetical protein